MARPSTSTSPGRIDACTRLAISFSCRAASVSGVGSVERTTAYRSTTSCVVLRSLKLRGKGPMLGDQAMEDQLDAQQFFEMVASVACQELFGRYGVAVQRAEE